MDSKLNSISVLLMLLSSLVWCQTSLAYEAPDDCELVFLDESEDNSSRIALTCHLSAINSNMEKTNFSVIPAIRTKSLTVKCSDSSLSTLEPGAFQSLHDLEELRLESCRLEHIPANAFSGLDGLKRLIIHTEHSSFLAIEEGSLSGVPQLEYLDLSGNYIRSLPPKELCNLPQLQWLNVSFNEIGSFSDIGLDQEKSCLSQFTLEESALDGLVNLEILDLSGNQLMSAQITPRLFQDPKSTLVELVLSFNQLDVISLENADLFSSLLSHLEALKLDNNQLSILPLHFAPPHLRELDLSHNRLTTLKSFGRLPQMTHLHLSHNKLHSIGETALANCSNVLVLDLSHNDLVEAPASLMHLKSLQTLDLSFNSIQTLEGAALLQMKTLWRLQLSGNRLGNISVGLLDELKALQILDVASNLISSVEKGSFDANRQLQAVRLDGNQLKSMDGLFGNLEQLIWLNISNNQIRHFDYALIPLHLHWLDISHNQLEELGNYFDLTGEIALGVLDAGFNRLRQLGPNSIPNSIETLLVNDNQIEQIVPYTFFKKTKLGKVDLTVNNLKSIDRNALRLSSEVERIPDFFLGGNPIECDCEMVWFKSINSANSLQNYPMVQDIESIYCRLIYTREVSFIPLVEARNEQFLCPYQTHCFALCKCCDFDACDCEMKNLRILHLNNSQIHSIQNKTFNGLRSLTVLHLEGNQLKELSGYEFETLDSLRELYLENNILDHISNATFKFLRSLEVLHLQGNRIIDFPVWELAFNPFLVSVKLAENLWSCECDFMERFRSWMTVYSSKIFDADGISCITNEAHDMNVRMADFDVSTCSNMQAIATTRVQEISTEDYLPLLAATLASFALFLLVLLALFMYRHTLRVWIHSKYGVRVFDNSFNEGDTLESGNYDKANANAINGGKMTPPKLFDVFISYSPKDDLFVRDVLASELEHGAASQYKACLFHRDIANHTYMADTLIQATEASRRTIVVLSDNFLKSEWSRYDYKSGLHQALRSGRRKLIVVLLGDISSRDVDPDLRLYLKTSIVLEWGDRLFWEKLRYALPDDTLEMKHQQNTHPPGTTRARNSTMVPASKSCASPTGGLTMQSSSTRGSPLSQASAVTVLGTDDHYYHQPRYATYMPPPPPVSSLANNLILNNNNPSSPGMLANLPGQQTPSRSSVVMHI
eukprot:maker-scaffold230_size244653-snap-gene-1.22 protein:Tk08246 transcript:maker-scaffold230_size244653-snap-gene-1.22-mRNA-1 annotation:"toll "